jgi:hypothetical protein
VPDASIYSHDQQNKAPSPMDAYGGALQLKGLIDQQALQELQRKQLEEADSGNHRIRDLFSAAPRRARTKSFAADRRWG